MATSSAKTEEKTIKEAVAYVSDYVISSHPELFVEDLKGIESGKPGNSLAVANKVQKIFDLGFAVAEMSGSTPDRFGDEVNKLRKENAALKAESESKAVESKRFQDTFLKDLQKEVEKRYAIYKKELDRYSLAGHKLASFVAAVQQKPFVAELVQLSGIDIPDLDTVEEFTLGIDFIKE